MGNPEGEASNERDVDGSSQAKGEVYESYGLVKSRFDELSLPRTVWLFKWVVLVVLSVYTGYLCEGIEVCLRRLIGINRLTNTTTVWCR